MDYLLWNLKDFILWWFLSMKWKCSDWHLYCLKYHLSFVRICSILFIKQCMFLMVMKITVYFPSMKTFSKTYSNNNMIHYIIWSQTMSSSQNMSNRIKDIHFDLRNIISFYYLLMNRSYSKSKLRIFLKLLFLFLPISDQSSSTKIFVYLCICFIPVSYSHMPRKTSMGNNYSICNSWLDTLSSNSTLMWIKTD